MAATSLPGALVVSLDFELFWGVRDKRTLEAYRSELLGAREIIPDILDMFEAYGVHATWATVGMLFLAGRAEVEQAAPSLRPTYADRSLSAYEAVSALGDDELSDPFHFAPSLIRRIAATPGQEIGTHTFSHYYCLEEGQTPEQFEADLRAALAVAERFGVTVSSLVFPRNQYDARYLEAARRVGVRIFRGTEDAEAYRARPDGAQQRRIRILRLADAYLNLTGNHTAPYPGAGGALANVPSSRLLRPFAPRLSMLEPLKRRRIYAGLEEAARAGRVFHLWWHPHNFGRHRAQNLDLLRKMLERYHALSRSHGMMSLNMGEIADLAGVAPAQPHEAAGAALQRAAG